MATGAILMREKRQADRANALEVSRRKQKNIKLERINAARISVLDVAQPDNAAFLVTQKGAHVFVLSLMAANGARKFAAALSSRRPSSRFTRRLTAVAAAAAAAVAVEATAPHARAYFDGAFQVGVAVMRISNFSALAPTRVACLRAAHCKSQAAVCDCNREAATAAAATAAATASSLPRRRHFCQNLAVGDFFF